MSEYLPSSATGDFGTLHPDSIEIWVPVRQDVVQLGMLDKKEHLPLEVTIGTGEVTIRRADGALLQVESHESRHGEKTRIPIFERPIDELRLRRLQEHLGRWTWQAGSENLPVSEVNLLGRFVGLVGTFAWAK
jgi:hypothetical protein